MRIFKAKFYQIPPEPLFMKVPISIATSDAPKN
jgi:hypothetical protein